MERKGQPAPEPERILWREPFRCHWRRFPVIRGLWRGSRRLWALVCVWFLATFALGFAFAEAEVVFFPALFSHPFLYLFGAISMLWAGTVMSFFILIGTVWVVQFLTPAKVLILGGDLVLQKPRMRLPISEIKEARVVGSPTGPQTFTITTANARRSVGIARGADISELKRLLGDRLVLADDGRIPPFPKNGGHERMKPELGGSGEDTKECSGPRDCNGAKFHDNGVSDDR